MAFYVLRLLLFVVWVRIGLQRLILIYGHLTRSNAQPTFHVVVYVHVFPEPMKHEITFIIPNNMSHIEHQRIVMLVTSIVVRCFLWAVTEAERNIYNIKIQ